MPFMVFARESASRRLSRIRRSPRPIRILVADDHSIDRSGIVALLGVQRDFEVVAETRTMAETAAHCMHLQPDVAIISAPLPDQIGVSPIASLRASCPEQRMIALADRSSSHTDALNPTHRFDRRLGFSNLALVIGIDCLQLAVSEGALGAIRRDAEPEELFQAVRAVAEGNAWLEPGTAAAMSRSPQGAGEENKDRALSPRELEVAGRISEGLSNKEIGAVLGISEPTVKKHVGHALEKLQFQGRLQIGIYIVRNPLLLQGKPGRPRRA
jgi:DNA-binding NarL/FixJ family response regulator